jgi:hypothetical protein
MQINLLYSPVTKLDLGIEYLRADRAIENGDDGAMNRLQFSAKSSF